MIPNRQADELAPAAALTTGDQSLRHLRPLENERKGAKFAALDYDVARVLGPQRGAAVLYGFLASTWFEYADPAKLAERHKKFTPGDWVEASYGQFMDISGTRSRDSVIRWLRILAEEAHACPWSRCADEHPLIVVHRQGQSKPNRYRKWRCGEDTLVARRRVRSEKLQEVARRRVASGQLLNGIDGSSPAVVAPNDMVPGDEQLRLLGEVQAGLLKSDSQTSEEGPLVDAEVRSTDCRASGEQTLESPANRLQEVRPADDLKSGTQTSLRVNTNKTKTDFVVSNTNQTAKTPSGAAIEEIDEVDAVACEVVEAIIALAQRIESDYPDERAWDVARKLAAVSLDFYHGQSEAARTALQNAIRDPRLARATNPVGLLIRGVLGDKDGRDRYLLGTPAANAPATAPRDVVTPRYETSTHLPPGLHEALLDAIRSGRQITPAWLRERDISPWALNVARKEVQAEAASAVSSTPLADAFEESDPAGFASRIDAILTTLPLVKTLDVAPDPHHPILRGMCLAQLERELETGQ